MRAYKALLDELRQVADIKGMIEVYEGLAAAKIQKLRELILAAREFHERLEKLSENVGSDFDKISAASADQKLVAVLVASNTGLYGDIIDKTFQVFFEFIRQHPTDVCVIGRVGETLMKTWVPTVPFHSLSLSDDSLEPEALDAVLAALFPYRKIMVFYGKFHNVAVQRASVSTISGRLLCPSRVDARALRRKRFRYLYEPSLESVSEMFANEILSTLLAQVLRESQLAKQGSRLMHLDQAVVDMRERARSLTSEKIRVKKNVEGKKQNTMVAGLLARGAR